MTKKYKINNVSSVVQNGDQNPTDLDHALAVAGLGLYNIKYYFVLMLVLLASVVEVFSYSYVLPSARCDLDINDSQRGLISSLPYIAIVVTSYPWGYLVDTKGRKRVILLSSIVCGVFGIAAAFMPDMISFTVCKFLASLCIACPAAAPFTYIGEILPQKHRDLALSLTNSILLFGSAFVPLLAWGILPLDFRIDFNAYDFRSWRLLMILYSSLFLIASLLLYFAPESPKYLASKGKHEEALEVLRNMYAINKGKSPEEYPIKYLKTMESDNKQKPSFLKSLKIQTLPLLKPPFVKWLALIGFLLFGIFSTGSQNEKEMIKTTTHLLALKKNLKSLVLISICVAILNYLGYFRLNGLFVWVPDVLNRVLTGDGTGMTACEVIVQGLNETEDSTLTECDDTIDTMTYIINSVASTSYAFIALAASVIVKFTGKKALLVFMYIMIGSFCISINFTTQTLVFAVFLSSLQLTAIGVGPVNAYAVEIFPTNLRGMAVSLAIMLGRTGSVIGTNVAGVMINAACEATFYSFGGLLLICGLVTFLLPKSNTKIS